MKMSKQNVIVNAYADCTRLSKVHFWYISHTAHTQKNWQVGGLGSIRGRAQVHHALLRLLFPHQMKKSEVLVWNGFVYA